MRCATAAEIKKIKGSRRQKIPAEGTKIRAIFDALHASKGALVDLTEIQHDTTTMIQLTDIYGLDIRQIGRGYCRTGKRSIWVLAGEWFGKVYIDYIAEHLEKRAVA